MIAFASLFLGLIVGTHPVQVLVDDSVWVVEYWLDGERVAHLEGPPWRAQVALGERLAPHELVAIAHDIEGQTVGTARQWINLPRSGAEGRLVVRGGETGQGATARLAFESIEREAPTAHRVVLDGRELPVDDVTQFDLPPFDPQSLHYLRVELEFGENTASVIETTFGGTYTDQTASEQMAVPILVGGETPAGFARELQGRFTKGGEPIRVLGIEEGPSEVILVRDAGAQPVIDDLVREQRRRLQSFTSLRFVAHLRKDQQVRFLTPFADRAERTELTYELFPSSVAFTRRTGGLVWFLVNHRPPHQASAEQRVADAVAVAGTSAAKNNRRRAVVLILGKDPQDASRLEPTAVRDYLSSLRVPLFVWSFGQEPTPAARGWGEAADISSLTKLERQAGDLARYLERQRIVWIEGLHLPQTLALRPGSPEISFAN